VILTSECRALDEGAITTYFKHLRFEAAATSGAQKHNLPFAKPENSSQKGRHYTINLMTTIHLQPIASLYVSFSIHYGHFTQCNLR
jgi:hypothetical protein